jgi:hypothetical protein
MNLSSKKALMRYLSRLDKGDPECPDEADIDPTWTEVEKVLDVREEDVYDIVDETPVVEEVSEVLPTSSRSSTAALLAQQEADAIAAAQAAAARLTDTKFNPSTVIASNESVDELTGLPKIDNTRVTTKTWAPLDRVKQLLARVCEDAYCVSFFDPVDTELYDDYLDIVETPMCLRDIQEKLEAGEYKGFSFVNKFLNDLRTVWRNCKSYNMYKSQIWYTAHVMSMMTERLYQVEVYPFLTLTLTHTLTPDSPTLTQNPLPP